MSTLKWKRIRAGWYESGPYETEGTYTVTNPDPGSWIIRRWTFSDGILDTEFIESTGSFCEAKRLAEFDNRCNTQSEVSA
jgi:hypothetical protein